MGRYEHDDFVRGKAAPASDVDRLQDSCAGVRRIIEDQRHAARTNAAAQLGALRWPGAALRVYGDDGNRAISLGPQKGVKEWPEERARGPQSQQHDRLMAIGKLRDEPLSKRHDVVMR